MSMGKKAAQAFGHLPAATRRDVVRHSHAGRAHPDADVAAVARGWAEYELRPVWWNRVPPWLLPLTATVLIVVGLVSGDTFLRWLWGCGGGLGVLLGLVGWYQRHLAKQVLAAMPTDV